MSATQSTPTVRGHKGTTGRRALLLTLATIFGVLLPTVVLAQPVDELVETWVPVGSAIEGEAPFDYLGLEVVMSGDGTTIVALGPETDDGGFLREAYARAFKFDGTSWNQLGTTFNEDGALGDLSALTISDDGTTIGFNSINRGAGNATARVQLYNFDGANWIQIGDINPGGVNDGPDPSISLSADGSIVAIGDAGISANGSFSGQVKIFGLDGASWNQLGDDIDGLAANDLFGEAVALSNDGNTVAIGASGHNGNDSFSGEVRVFSFDGADWSHVGNDINGAPDDRLGRDLSISDDGSTILAAANNSASVFRFNGSSWAELGTAIETTDAASLSLSGDGTTIALGSPAPFRAVPQPPGFVQAYRFDGIDWNPYANTIEGASIGDGFANSVAISNDGTTIASGAWRGGNQGVGRVRVFEVALLEPPIVPEPAGTWDPNSVIEGVAPCDFLGENTLMSADGTTIVAYSPVTDDCGVVRRDFVRAFKFDGTNWNQLGDTFNEDGSGVNLRTLAVSDDGTTIAMSSNQILVNVYRFDGINWAQLGGSFREDVLDGPIRSLALNANGTVITLSDTTSDANGRNSGQVKVFGFDGGDWTQRGNGINGVAIGDNFGRRAAISNDGNTVAIGDRKGRVRVFRFNGADWAQFGNNLDGFVGNIEISGDGDTIAVGTTSRVQVFRSDGADWNEVGAGIGSTADSFAMSGDGNTVAVGSPEPPNANPRTLGFVRAFRLDGDEWAPYGNDIEGEAIGDRFANSVAISNDGNIIASGAPRGGNQGVGRVRLFAFTPFETPVLADGGVIFLSNVASGRYLDSDAKFQGWNVDTSRLAKQDDAWRLGDNGDGTWSLKSQQRNRYLDADGPSLEWNVGQSFRATEDDRWELIEQSDGSYTLRNAFYDRYLSQADGDNNVITVAEADITNASRWAIVTAE